MVIYRYGPMAHVWRLLAGAGLSGGAVLAGLLLREGSWVGLWIGLPLMLPALLLAPMVAVRIDRLADGAIDVRTLAFWRRRITRDRLGKPRLQVYAQATYEGVSAPRIWVPVRGGLPLHVDLLGAIPDRRAFLAVFDLPPGRLPQR